MLPIVLHTEHLCKRTMYGAIHITDLFFFSLHQFQLWITKPFRLYEKRVLESHIWFTPLAVAAKWFWRSFIRFLVVSLVSWKHSMNSSSVIAWNGFILSTTILQEWHAGLLLRWLSISSQWLSKSQCKSRSSSSISLKQYKSILKYLKKWSNSKIQHVLLANIFGWK